MTSVLTLSQERNSGGNGGGGSSSNTHDFAIPGFELDPILADSDDDDDDDDGGDLFGLMHQQTVREQQARNQGVSHPTGPSGTHSASATSAPPQDLAPAPAPTLTPTPVSAPSPSLPQSATSHASQRAGPSRIRLSASPVMDDVEMEDADPRFFTPDAHPEPAGPPVRNGSAEMNAGGNSAECGLAAPPSGLEDADINAGGDLPDAPRSGFDNADINAGGDLAPGIPAASSFENPEMNAAGNVKTEGGNDDDDDDVILTAVKVAPRARAKLEVGESSSSGPSSRPRVPVAPVTAAQRFFAGIADDFHDRDSRIDPPSALDHLCAMLTNADLVSVAHVNYACYSAALSRIYSTIEINGPNQVKLSRVLTQKPALAEECKILRIWDDGALRDADSPTPIKPGNRLEWIYVREIMQRVNAKADKKDFEFQVNLGMSQLHHLVSALAGEGAPSEDYSNLTKALRKLTVVLDLNYHHNAERFNKAWNAVKHLFECLGANSRREIASVQELHILSRDDYQPRMNQPRRTGLFLWHAFGKDDEDSFSWPNLRQLSLRVLDAEQLTFLNEMDLPNLTNLTIDAATKFVTDEWDVGPLDELLCGKPELEAISIKLTTDHEFQGQLFSSYHPNLKFLLYHGPPQFRDAFDKFVARHQETLISLDAGFLSADLESLKTQTFPRLRLLDLRHVPDNVPLKVPPQALAHIACSYEAIVPKALRGPRGRGNGPSVKPSGATAHSGKPRKNKDGSDASANASSEALRLLDAEIPPSLSIITLQSLTSLELTLNQYQFTNFTHELQTSMSSRIFPNLLELKILGDRPDNDRTPLYLKKGSFQLFLLALANAYALRAVTIEEFCDYIPDEKFLGPLCPFGPALEFVLVRTCGATSRAWRIVRSVPDSAGTRQLIGLGDSEGREYAVNRPVVAVQVVPVDDFGFTAVHDLAPADAWKDLSFFPHYHDAERKRILKSTKEMAMIGVIPGAETHHESAPKAQKKPEAGEMTGPGGPSPSKRAAVQRMAAAISSHTTAEMYASSQPVPRVTRAIHHRTEWERIHQSQQDRPGPSQPASQPAPMRSHDQSKIEVASPSARPLKTSASPSKKASRLPATNDHSHLFDDGGTSSSEDDDVDDGDGMNGGRQPNRTGERPSTSGKQPPPGFQPLSAFGPKSRQQQPHVSPSRSTMSPSSPRPPSEARTSGRLPANGSALPVSSSPVSVHAQSQPEAVRRRDSSKAPPASQPMNGSGSSVIFTQAGPSRVRRRSSTDSLDAADADATPRAVRTNGVPSASQPSGGAYDLSARRVLKKARNANAGRASIGTNGFVIPQVVSSSASPEPERGDREREIIEAAQNALRSSQSYRGAQAEKSASPASTSQSDSDSGDIPGPSRKAAASVASKKAASWSGSGYPPGAGKSLDIAMKVHEDVVDLTSSPEPEDAAGNRRRQAAAEAGPSTSSSRKNAGSTRASGEPERRSPAKPTTTTTYPSSQPSRAPDRPSVAKASSQPIRVQPSSEDESDGFEILD
ncbi:unnamed protein product [Tilletia caries]|nr:unnamed protein product [Tilletia caries]